MCIREGKDQACGCLCSAKLELKFFFPEYDQKKKKSDGDGVCRCVGGGVDHSLGRRLGPDAIKYSLRSQVCVSQFT